MSTAQINVESARPRQTRRQSAQGPVLLSTHRQSDAASESLLLSSEPHPSPEAAASSTTPSEQLPPPEAASNATSSQPRPVPSPRPKGRRRTPRARGRQRPSVDSRVYCERCGNSFSRTNLARHACHPNLEAGRPMPPSVAVLEETRLQSGRRMRFFEDGEQVGPPPNGQDEFDMWDDKGIAQQVEDITKRLQAMNKQHLNQQKPASRRKSNR